MTIHRGGRAAVVFVCLLALPALLAGCAKKATGSGALGALGHPTASAAPAPTPIPTVTVTATAGGGSQTSGSQGGGQNGGGQNGGGAPTSKPPVTATTAKPKPSSPKPPQIKPVTDYAANLVTGGGAACFWEVTSADNLVVGAVFAITEPTGLGPTAIPITISDNLGDSRSVASQAINFNFPGTIGSHAADSSNAFLGRTVDVTVTVKPQSGDDNASDDSATVGVQVPDASHIPAAENAPAVLPCIG